jgi:hypothetical protein
VWCGGGWGSRAPPKQGHSTDRNEEEEAAAAAAAAAAVAAANVPEVIVRDGKHPCVKFELDLKNDKGGYGFCLCGFNRVDHENFHKDPAEWHNVREKLTAPKEFV